MQGGWLTSNDTPVYHAVNQIYTRAFQPKARTTGAWRIKCSASKDMSMFAPQHIDGYAPPLAADRLHDGHIYGDTCDAGLKQATQGAMHFSQGFEFHNTDNGKVLRCLLNTMQHFDALVMC